MEKIYTIFWNNGTTDLIIGKDAGTAFLKSNVSHKNLNDMKMYLLDDVKDNYKFNLKTSTWNHV